MSTKPTSNPTRAIASTTNHHAALLTQARSYSRSVIGARCRISSGRCLLHRIGNNDGIEARLRQGSNQRNLRKIRGGKTAIFAQPPETGRASAGESFVMRAMRLRQLASHSQCKMSPQSSIA